MIRQTIAFVLGEAYEHTALVARPSCAGALVPTQSAHQVGQLHIGIGRFVLSTTVAAGKHFRVAVAVEVRHVQAGDAVGCERANETGVSGVALRRTSCTSETHRMIVTE